FLADYHRHYELSKDKGTPIAYDKTEQLIVGTVDAALAAQNLAVAAESMGLGMCYIGSLRNDMAKVIEILELRKGVIPLFGMVVGKPDHAEQRDRKSTRLNSSHVSISYAVFCLKKKRRTSSAVRIGKSVDIRRE